MAIIDNLGGGMGASAKEQLQAIYDKVVDKPDIYYPTINFTGPNASHECYGYTDLYIDCFAQNTLSIEKIFAGYQATYNISGVKDGVETVLFTHSSQNNDKTYPSVEYDISDYDKIRINVRVRSTAKLTNVRIYK